MEILIGNTLNGIEVIFEKIKPWKKVNGRKQLLVLKEGNPDGSPANFNGISEEYLGKIGIIAIL